MLGRRLRRLTGSVLSVRQFRDDSHQPSARSHATDAQPEHRRVSASQHYWSCDEDGPSEQPAGTETLTFTLKAAGKLKYLFFVHANVLSAAAHTLGVCFPSSSKKKLVFRARFPTKGGGTVEQGSQFESPGSPASPHSSKTCTLLDWRLEIVHKCGFKWLFMCGLVMTAQPG